MTSRARKLLGAACAAALAAPLAHAVTPISFTGGTYFENFDYDPTNPNKVGLPYNARFNVATQGRPIDIPGWRPTSATDPTPIQTVLPGWQASHAGGQPNTLFRVTDGRSTTTGVVSSTGFFWQNADPEPVLAVPPQDAISSGVYERSLSSVSTGDRQPRVGVFLKNESQTTYTSFDLNFIGEQWRDEVAATNTLEFSFGIRQPGSALDVAAGDFTRIPQVDFVSPATGTTDPGATGINGNDPANQRVLEGTVSEGFVWRPGEILVVRWTDASEVGDDDYGGIDNFSLTPGTGGRIPNRLKWDLTKAGDWNTNPSNLRWIRLEPAPQGPSAFTNSDHVEFSDNPTGTAIVNIDGGGVAPLTTTVKHESGTYSFRGGSITSGSLTKTGAGNLVIANANQFSSVSLTGTGIVELQADGALGTGGISANNVTVKTTTVEQTIPQAIAINGTLTLDVADVNNGFPTDLTLNASPTGANATLVKKGPGRLHINPGIAAMTNGLLDIQEGYVTAGTDAASGDDVIRVAAGATFDESFGDGDHFGSVEGAGTFILHQGEDTGFDLGGTSRRVFDGVFLVGFDGQVDGSTFESIELVEFEKSGTHTLVLTNPESDFVSRVEARNGVLETPILNDRREKSPIGRGNVAFSPLVPGSDIILGFSNAAGTTQTFGTLRYTGPSASTDRSIGSAGLGGALEISNADTVLTYNGTLEPGSDTAIIAKSGPGTLRINSDQSSFTGTLAVRGGKLVIPATSNVTQEPIFFGAGQGIVRAEQGGTLTGNGTINGTITSTARGTINPGDVGTIGTLTASSLNLDAADLQFDINGTTGTGDKLVISAPDGAATQTSQSLFTFTNLGGALRDGQKFVLIDYNGTSPDISLFESSQFNLEGKGLYIENDPALTAVVLRIGAMRDLNQWALNANGDWSGSATANWIGPVPNAVGAKANFLGKITAPRTVTVTEAITVGEMTFDNATASYTIASSETGSLTLNNGSAGAAVIRVVNGTHNITAPLTIPAGASGTQRSVVNLDVAPTGTLNIASPVTLDANTTVAKVNTGVANLNGGVALVTASSILNAQAGTLNARDVAGTRTSSEAEPNRFLGDVNVAAGATLNANHIRIDDLTSNGTAALRQSGTSADSPTHSGTSQVEALSLGETTAAPDPVGKLDIANNRLIIKGDPAGSPAQLAQVRNALIKGRNAPVGGVSNGKWDGATGITSSSAVAENGGGAERRSVGYALNSELLSPKTNFGGEPVNPTDILVRYTRNGDANLDGVVNNNDITILAGFYRPGTTGRHWYQGDFNYDGTVDNNDITILAGFYAPTATPIGTDEPPAAGLVAVPEPGIASLLAVGAMGLLARRRRNA